MSKGMWRGDIIVSGFIPFSKAKQFYGTQKVADEQIRQAKEENKTEIFQQDYCGHRVQVASVVVRRFLAIGVIPQIEGTLKEEKVEA